MKTLVFGNLFKPFRLAITFAREVYHYGIKMKTNMTIAFFHYPQQQTARTNVMVSLKCANKLPNTFGLIRSTGVGGLIALQNGNLRR